MANPFTAFAFPASGTPTPPCSPVSCNITLPSRIAQIRNVKDFGAKGDGVTDDWAAVQAAVNFNITPIGAGGNLGIIYFPPGTYSVSQQIYLGVPSAGVNDSVNAYFLGEMGASTITANFSDYVFARIAGNGIQTVFDGLTIVNTNASGGGIRFGGTNGGAIRNCNVTANQGISTFNADTKTYFGSFEISIENCTLSPGTNIANSQGLMLMANGPVINCRILNYAIGALTAGGEGAQNIIGCYFEKCGSAVLLGVGPDGSLDEASGVVIAGCWFKNNTVAINCPHAGSQLTIVGIRIEGTNGQGPSGGDSNYAIQNGSSSSTMSQSLIGGVTVLGQYDTTGIYFPGGSLQESTVAATHSVAWNITPQGANGSDGTEFIACDVAPVFTVAQIGVQNEGDFVNVSDGTNALGWGAQITNTGTHTTHYKGRYNGSIVTVVGQ